MKPTLVLILLAAGGVASADNKSKADELFKQAKKLMAEKRFNDACPKFEESYKLDPGIGGELNIGRCYEEWGKLGRAYHAYAEAEKQAKAASDPRAAKIHDLVTGIEPQVPRLMIHIPPESETDGLKLSIDGNVIDKENYGNAQLVDPGPKQVDYTLPGGFKKSTLIPVERGSTTDVTLELPKAKAKPDKGGDKEQDKVITTTAPEPGRTQRIAGIAVGATGVAMMGVSTYLALAARSKYKDALAANCNNAADMCNAQGLKDTHDARHNANIATIVFSVGVAATAGGVVMYLIAPKAASSEHAYYLSPTIAPDSAAVVFGGRL